MISWTLYLNRLSSIVKPIISACIQRVVHVKTQHFESHRGTHMYYTTHLPINQWDVINVYVMFKTRAAVFGRDLKPRGAAEWF